MDTIKLIVIEEKHVGKTSIIMQYIYNIFSQEYIMTVSADKSIKEIELKNKTKIKIEIWIQSVKNILEQSIKNL